ncbi:MAG: hypothetical protein M1826_000582 [Phylliscum demangeonii]|nr:MAG: hypothetical protein M1826_000582 [Phylliscum demangeonii]
MSKKRTLDSFFSSTQTAKKARSAETAAGERPTAYSRHPAYPSPIPHLPSSISDELTHSAPASKGKEIREQPDLDLLYFQPYIPKSIEAELFHFLRRSLPFYRVEYKIQRGGVEAQIRTPRYTTVFGVDETSIFSADDDDDRLLLDAKTGQPIPADAYKCRPRPIPQCLDVLRKSIEQHTPHPFNICLVNYYASGADSISYHSDDERFLDPQPAIASFSLGATRDFLLKHKATAAVPGAVSPPLKFVLRSGDMLLMRGPTQAHWLHSVPKRREGGGGGGGGGRINITFRCARLKAGTENYYRYNVGLAPVPAEQEGDGEGEGEGAKQGSLFRWDDERGEMR